MPRQLRLLTKSAASENQEQARLCRTVKRLIFVPFRPAALPPLAAQNPRSGVCHHSEDISHFQCENVLVPASSYRQFVKFAPFTPVPGFPCLFAQLLGA